MSLQVRHAFNAPRADGADVTQVQPSHWNAQHVVSGFNFPIKTNTDYDFTAQTPGGNLTGGITNAITLTPVPDGVNATNLNHYLYIVDGASSEAVKITGGTAVSGAASGSITFVPVNNHSGAWQIKSATSGIQEVIYDAWVLAPGIPGIGDGIKLGRRLAVFVAPNFYLMYGPIYIPEASPAWFVCNADLWFTAAIGSHNGITVDSQDGSHFEFNGTITYHGTSNALYFSPQHPNSKDNIYRLEHCYISIAQVQCFREGGSIGVDDPINEACVFFESLGTIVGQGLIAHNMIFIASTWGGRVGVELYKNPTGFVPGSGGFEEGQWFLNQICGYSHCGFKVNLTDYAMGGMFNTLINITVLAPDLHSGAYPGEGIDFGCGSVGIYCTIGNTSLATGKTAVTFGQGTGGVVVRGALNGNPIVNNSGGYTNQVIALGLGGILTQEALTVPDDASAGYVWQNTTNYVPMMVVVSGGTVTQLRYSYQGSEWQAVPVNGAYFIENRAALEFHYNYGNKPTVFLYYRK